jgi:hypothetical protein
VSVGCGEDEDHPQSPVSPVYKGVLRDFGEDDPKNKNILVVRKIVSIFAFANLERQKLNR